jgi:hypothetical protein
MARAVCGYEPVRSASHSLLLPIIATIGQGETLPRSEQFVISAVPKIGLAQDGRRCLIQTTDLDGKRLDLVFSPEDAPGLANGILSAVSIALSSADGRERLAASLVRGFRVEATPEHSHIMLVLLIGVAEMPYALPPKLSAKLRADLQAAESATKPR